MYFCYKWDISTYVLRTFKLFSSSSLLLFYLFIENEYFISKNKPPQIRIFSNVCEYFMCLIFLLICKSYLLTILQSYLLFCIHFSIQFILTLCIKKKDNNSIHNSIKKIKFIGINLTNKGKIYIVKIIKLSWKKLKKTQTGEKISHDHGSEELIIINIHTTLSLLYIQSLSKF